MASWSTLKNRHSTEGHLLLEITLIDKTLYLSDNYRTVTNRYEGLVADWGDIDTDKQLDSGLSSVGDTEVTLFNKRMEFMTVASHGNKFSNLFDDYDFDYRDARILQWFETLDYTDAEELFKGQIRIKEFDRNQVILKLIHKDEFDLIIPKENINSIDHPEAPGESIGLPIPIPFGALDSIIYLSPIPMILIDKNTLKFQVSKYQLNATTTPIVRWIDELNTYMTLVADNKTITNNSGGCTVELNDPVLGTVIVYPMLEGTLNDTGYGTDWKKAIDGDENTVCTMDGDNANKNQLSLKIGSMPELGRIQDWIPSSLELGITVSNLSPASPDYVKLLYYNEGYNDGAGGYSTGEITTDYDFAIDKSKKGVATDQSDRLTAWTWPEIGDLELVVQAQAGYTFGVEQFYLTLRNIVIVSPWAVRPRRTRRVSH